MDDITPLNLEDSSKLFGLRMDQLIWVMVSFVLSTQFYSWLGSMPFAFGDFKLYFCLFVFMIGPLYCLLTLNHSASHWETVASFYTSSRIMIPGPDPNPTRFLTDEKLPEFFE